MIKINSLSKSFNDQKILDEVSFDINSGEILVILGESGTGKSVLLKHMVGVLKPDNGTINIDGENITELSEKELLKVRQKMGYLFQEGALYDFMDVFENIAFPLREHTKLTAEEIKKRVTDILELIDLVGVEKKLPSELSGGMKKRVALARSMILDSKVLFCDEPTSGLDPIRSRDISDLIRSVSKKQGCTTVVTSHDMKNAFRIADRLLLLKDGKIVLMGSKEDFTSSTDKFVREFVDG
ncbi:MAG: phospholipid/cholesterol/gamma-HCH transport system ATP-binding protein [Lysobacterales bacterium]|jgi:phospholipid/cholesterol/gamma-HCH transport system ATP-binding protein